MLLLYILIYTIYGPHKLLCGRSHVEKFSEDIIQTVATKMIGDPKRLCFTDEHVGIFAILKIKASFKNNLLI